MGGCYHRGRLRITGVKGSLSSEDNIIGLCNENLPLLSLLGETGLRGGAVFIAGKLYNYYI